MSQKRNRSINWDEEEKQLFRSVLKEYSQIIENKSLDTNTNKIKASAWEQVHKKFNDLNSRSRDLNQLKIQWKTMKINARKTYSTYKKEVNKTGGGARPATPNEAVIEVKDLLNPAELLIDHNVYDSDGLIVGELEPTLIDSQGMRMDNSHIENEQILPLLGMETNVQISQENATIATPVEKKVDSITAKTYEDEITLQTPMKTSMGTESKKKIVKRKIMSNNILNSSMKPRKDHEDYVNSMLTHSRMLKDEEHMRRMEMAEEDHKMKMEMVKEDHKMKMEMATEVQKIKMEIQREKLKSALLEREILEMKKAHENLYKK